MTHAAFAAKEGIGLSTLDDWRRRYATNSGRRRSGTNASPRFVEITSAAEAASGSIEIVFRGGRVLRLPATIACDRLRELVEALES